MDGRSFLSPLVCVSTRETFANANKEMIKTVPATVVVAPKCRSRDDGDKKINKGRSSYDLLRADAIVIVRKLNTSRSMNYPFVFQV